MTTQDQHDCGAREPDPLAHASALTQDYRRELEVLSRLLRNEQRQVAEHRQQLDWFARVHQSLASHPRWWWLLSAPGREARRRKRLKTAGLFDAEAYLRRYPDVATAGCDPLHHYMNDGIHEDRIAISPDDERVGD